MFSAAAGIPAKDSVRVFLRGLFDYAGLFPPASLPLSEAIAEYTEARRGADAWMTGPFVCTVDHLSSMPETEWAVTEEPMRFSVLSRYDAESSDGFANDVERVERFVSRSGGRTSVDMMEIRLSPAATTSARTFRAAVDDIADGCAPLGESLRYIYLEPVRAHDFESSIAGAAAVLGGRRGDSSGFGLKIRCGGMAPTDYPSSDEVAAFILAAVREDVRFKATAGLHHPIRHWREEAGTYMHGFLNVFFAAALLATRGIDRAEVVRMLDDEDPAAFSFSESGISWRNLAASSQELSRVRGRLASSIGSCSFDEPREDLERLKWLEYGHKKR